MILISYVGGSREGAPVPLSVVLLSVLYCSCRRSSICWRGNDDINIFPLQQIRGWCSGGLQAALALSYLTVPGKLLFMYRAMNDPLD